MIWRPTHHRIIAQIADAVTTLISFLAAYYLWVIVQSLAPTWLMGSDMVIDSDHVMIMIVSALVWVIIFNCQGAYSYQRFTSFSTEIRIIFKTVLWGTLLLLGLAFLLRPGYIPRTMVALFIMVNLGLLTLEKLLLFAIARIVRQRGNNRKTVLMVGTGNQARQFVETIHKHFYWGLDIVGFLDPAKAKVGREIFGKKILGTFNDIPQVLQAHPVNEVIITVSTRRLGEVREVLEICEREGVQVRIISDFLGQIAKRFRADMLYGLPIISISYVPGNRGALAVKRGMDIVISLAALITLAPLFLIIAAAIKFSGPGPVFYEWNVVGCDKKPFKSWKFRTMVVGADKMKAQLEALNEMEGPVFKIARDPRITPVGRILRKFSLDELPQLWSVLKGDMSLVGPRPAFEHELARYDSWQRRKLSIKPGITCFWQVSGRNKINKFNDWAKMDLEYIDNWSLWLDCKILLKTISTVIFGRGAS
jgi:exopolysaccharide biosynthesis polyprenyl glycosylphosphotransferase